MNNERQKGIWIPNEILQDKRLDLSTKIVLAVYKYYTIEGELHCCMLTNSQISDKIGISTPTVQRAKRLLKELKLIKSDGGIKVWYKGYQNDTHNNASSNTNTSERGIKMTPQGYQNDTPPHQNDTHNKDLIKKEKKDNKSTIEHKSNTYNKSTSIDELELLNPTLFKLLMDGDEIEVLNYLTDNYSQDNIDYIRSWWADDDIKLQGLERFIGNM